MGRRQGWFGSRASKKSLWRRQRTCAAISGDAISREIIDPNEIFEWRFGRAEWTVFPRDVMQAPPVKCPW
jgi:hypothetical protein